MKTLILSLFVALPAFGAPPKIGTNEVALQADFQIVSNAVNGKLAATNGAAVGLIVTATGATQPRTLEMRFGESINILDHGADAGGITNATPAFEAARTRLLSISPDGGEVYFPAGTYKGHFTVDARVSIRGAGAGERATILTNSDPSVAVITIDSGGISTNREFATYSDFWIRGGQYGIIVGTNALSRAANVRIERVRVTDFTTYALWIRSLTHGAIRDCNFEDGAPATSIGVYIDNERDVQLVEMTGVRSRRNWVGGWFGSGNRFAIEHSRFESNDQTGLYLDRRKSSGFAHASIRNCWFENNGHTLTATNETAAQIYLDGDPTYGLTNAHNLIFTHCAISSGALTNVSDISARRAQYVLLEQCSLTATSLGGFTTNKLKFDTTSAAAFVLLRQCGELNRMPTPAIYANFPELSVVGAGGSTLGAAGFIYEFDYQGRRYSNRLPFGISGSPSGSLTPAFVGEIVKDTTGNVLYIATGLTSSDWSEIAP